MRALICGAGIAGLALARDLLELGWEVILVERGTTLRDGGYLIDFLGPGYDAAEAMGLLPRLRELAYEVTDVHYVDRSGRTRARVNYRQMADALDGRLLSLARGDLVRALADAVGDRAEWRFGRTVARIPDPGDDGRPVEVGLSDGSSWTGDLLIGADGIHSEVRRLAFGPEHDHLRFLGFHTTAYLTADPDLHERLGGQFALTDTADRAVGLFPLRDGQVAVFGVHRTAETALPADPRAVVRRTYAELGWLVPDALRTCPEPPDLYYDQVAQISMPSWVRGRVGLVGDACSAVSLLAGQGASLAVAAAHLLADELTGTEDVTAALGRYQARLVQPVATRQEAGRRTARWFLPESGTQLLLRRAVLRAMRVPGIHRLVGSRLVGAAGGIP